MHRFIAVNISVIPLFGSIRIELRLIVVSCHLLLFELFELKRTATQNYDEEASTSSICFLEAICPVPGTFNIHA